MASSGGGAVLKKALLLIILSFSCITVFAGDYPESIITDADVDVFLGEITEINDDVISIAVLKSLFNCYETPGISLGGFMYMTGENDKSPKTGDLCAIAVKYENDSWQLVNGLAVKSDSTDEKTLTLYSGGNNFAIRMNEYINNGNYSGENRKHLLSLMKNDETSESNINENVAIADENTSIATNAKTEDDTVTQQNVPKKPMRRPLREYVFITVFSMAGGFAASKIVQKMHQKRKSKR